MTSLPQHSIRLTVLAGFSLALVLGACSSDNGSAKGSGGSTGGATAAGGGGVTSAAGSVATGGNSVIEVPPGGSTQPTGGTSGAGGVTASSTPSATGGSTVTGGSSVTSGSTAPGGNTATGGSTATGGGPGGRSGVGGTTGGSSAVGGTTGGSSPVGGTIGGSSAAGGRMGGTTAAGGGPGGSSPSGGRMGGTTATGGRAGGTTAAAGSTATGGTTPAGGASTDLQALVKAMAPGWNLGNSFDGAPQVTSWGNPAPNQTLINAVHAAGFNLMRLPVTWTDHIGAAPAYTIDATWMAQVVQTAQWAIDAGMYVFVNTHHDADGEWVTFPTDPTPVTAEVTAVWTQIATAFAGFSNKLMFECFNEPHSTSGGGNAGATLNLYLAACVNAVRGTGGANATRVIMIQPIGASPSQSGINTMLQATIIKDPNLVISIHTYEPTNFGLSTTPYAWGSSSDYTSMASSVTQLLSWLPGWGVVIGEWGSESAQATTNRAAHALAYSQDTTTAGMCPVWWDNGGSYAIFNRTTGAITYPTIVSGIITGAKQGLATPGTYATLANP
ncbi:MAG: glycoside hydrolase family 5 protein [Polyangia bacterium]